VKDGDINFPVENENLVRVIIGCTIAQKIEKNDSYISDLLAISLQTTEHLHSKLSILPEILVRAREFWIVECEKNKGLDEEPKITQKKMKVSSKAEMPETSQDPNTLKIHADSVKKIVTGLNNELVAAYEEINSINSALNIFKLAYSALAEETNILWWLFGAFSKVLKKPFNKLTLEALSVIAPIELAELTKSLPGAGSIDAILIKALSNVDLEAGKKLTFESIVESIKTEERSLKAILIDMPQIYLFTPFLFAIKCHLDYAGSEWKAVYKQQIPLKANYEISALAFSAQLYKELMLQKVYKEIIE